MRTKQLVDCSLIQLHTCQVSHICQESPDLNNNRPVSQQDFNVFSQSAHSQLVTPNSSVELERLFSVVRKNKTEPFLPKATQD